MEQRHHQNSNVLAIVGGVLVVVGLLALIIASWDSFTPLGRILTASLPLVALYALVGYSTTNEESKKVGKYALIAASIALPLVVGVILYQTEVFTEVHAGMIALLAGISALNSLFIEFMYGDRLHTPLSLLSLFVAAVSTGVWLELSGTGIFTLLFLVGALMLSLGIMQSTAKVKGSVVIWQTTGAVLTLFSLVGLPLMFGNDIVDEELRATLVPLFYVAASGITLLISVMFSRMWQAQKKEHYLYDLRVLFEQFTAFMLMVPAILSSLSSDAAGPFLVLLGASLVCMGISSQVRVGTFRVLAITGFAVALIRLIMFGLEELSAVWPIVLVATGILFLALAIFGARKATMLTQNILVAPEKSWENLGEPFAHEVASKEDKKETKDTSGWFWLILGILALWFLSSL